MATDARGLQYDDLVGGRVSYDLLTDELVVAGTPSNNLKHSGSAPEIIKIALATGTEATFFGAAPTYAPINFDRTILNEIYGDQIFLNVDDQKNFLWTSEAVEEPCLGVVKDFIDGKSFIETRYLQSAEGEDLVDSYGVEPDLPYVSGFGVNQIFDLTPMSDDRYNKNAYVGNAFALPEYYDFPYSSEIYFDTSNPFHWKIKDFHYRYYEEQAVGVTNIGFAKLTYNSGVLISSDELLLYPEGKGLECTTSGIAYEESTVAYGTWEFEMSKKSDAKNEGFSFISGDTTASGIGYSVQFTVAEQVKLNRTGEATVLSSAAAYIDLDVLYGIKIMRNSVLDEFVTGAIGTFVMYIKGGSFGDTYVLVDVTGGSGTNPKTDNTYTTSAYTVLDLDTGDRIANYTINGTLLDTRDFTQTTGVYTVTSELEDPKLSSIQGYVTLLPPTYEYYKNEE